jgi:hypothetical protein
MLSMDAPDPTRQFQSLVSDIGHLTPEERLVSAYVSVRDIPYGGANSPNPFGVLVQNRGTGKGKHMLLKLVFEALGYEVKEYWCRHDFTKMPIEPWPAVLEEFRKEPLIGFHDFIKVKIGDRFVAVDATYDKPLAALGFPSQEWDGKSEMELPVHCEEIFPVEAPIDEHKRRLVKSLTPEMQDRRKRFLKTLKKWMEEERAKMKVES